MAKIIHDLSLRDIAPPSIKDDDTVRNIISSIDPELLQVSDSISEAFIISRIDSLPEPVLDLLAWQWHVDFYELANSISAKREMVKSSIEWHRHKGTRYAIIKALEMLGVEAKFTAWYEEEENKDNPYTFAIDAKLTGIFWERVDWTKPTQTIRRAILESKAARSYMSRLFVYFEDETSYKINVGVAGFSGTEHTIKPTESTHSETISGVNVGLGGFSGTAHNIGFTQNTQCETKSALSFAIAGFSGANHTIDFTKNTNLNYNLRIVTATGFSQGVNYFIGMKPRPGNAEQKIGAGQVFNRAANYYLQIKEL